MTKLALKSIHPVNLLSFGPETEPIGIRPLNILIGANGSGKSNLIDMVRLLHSLPEREPWSGLAGGATDWVWKGSKGSSAECSLSASFSIGDAYQESKGLPIDQLDFRMELEASGVSFRVKGESIRFSESNPAAWSRYRFGRTLWEGWVEPARGTAFSEQPASMFSLAPDRSILSQLASPSVGASVLGSRIPEAYAVSDFLGKFDFHQGWEFGVGSAARAVRSVGRRIDRLEEDGANLAQMLAYYRDYHPTVFERLKELLSRFYEAAKGVSVKLISTSLEIRVEEKTGHSTPAPRMSDGTLRWLAILCILLNPDPPPVTCIDEPELGLHPDIMPTLADLLRDASTRTQLIVTTHSPTLIDAFSRPEDAESVCVTEKVDGSTVIRRLKADELAIWLEEYSLGSLWTSGQIGGNRW
jgi:predicted ATPase